METNRLRSLALQRRKLQPITHGFPLAKCGPVARGSKESKFCFGSMESTVRPLVMAFMDGGVNLRVLLHWLSPALVDTACVGWVAIGFGGPNFSRG